MSASKHHLYHRLQLAAHVLNKAADKAVLESANITTAQAALLGIVRSGRQVTQKHIASTLSINESAVTAMVNRLLKLGYLQRQRSTTDARAWLVSVSDSGLEALKSMVEPFSEINAILDDAIPSEKMDDLVIYLKKITNLFSSD
ncbi:MAG: MarR family transcriptional regulator [Sneathiella sp.]|nr:MarR family transcriptional regulator [Sneathiella sp.]